MKLVRYTPHRQSRSDGTKVAVGFSPRMENRGGQRRGATLDRAGDSCVQASLRDAHILPPSFRGLKPTATFTASLREAQSGVATFVTPVTLRLT